MIKNILLFPGVLFHELSHYVMCLILGVPVRKFNISIKDISGFVEHVVPKSIIKSILISIAPGILAIFTAYFLLQYYPASFYLDILRYYLIFIFLYTSLPSKEDTRFYKHHNLTRKIVTFPLFLIFTIFYLFGKSSILRLIYSIVVILLITSPELIMFL